MTSFPRSLRIPALLGLLACAHASPLRAQDSTAATLPAGTAIGASIGRLFLESFEVTTIALHVTDLNPGRAGLDFALATPPRAVSEGVVLLLGDLGVAYNLAQRGATFLPKAGASVLAGEGDGEGDALFGFHYGVGAVIGTGRRQGIRVDLVGRRYFEFLSASTLTLSVGLTSLPRAFDEAQPAPVAVLPPPAP